VIIRRFRVVIVGAVLAAVVAAVGAVPVLAQWPTTCVELNDIVETHLGNDNNVGIYQRVFGDQAEAACQNDHRDDVRGVFAWAFDEADLETQTDLLDLAWPTDCVELNDIVEAHLGNDNNVEIYQRVFGEQAEPACRNDHREDVRGVFAWAFGEADIATPTHESTATPTPEPAATSDSPITDMSLAVEAMRPSRSAGFRSSIGSLIERGRLRVEEALTLAVLVQCEAGTLSGWTADQHQAEPSPYVAGRPAPCFATTDTVTWVSSDDSVATVNRGYMDHFATQSGGIVRAVGTGAARVTAYFNGNSTSLDIEVVPGADIGARANWDRPDDRDGKQIHFVYAVPIGDENLEYDRDGDIALIATWMQEWLRERTGMAWRFDTHGGEIDVSFLPIRFAASDLDDLDTHLNGIIRQFNDALEAREGGQLDPDKKYAVFFHYDGAEGVFGPAGIADEQMAVTLIHGPFHELVAGVAIHELLHTLGAVPHCAPHSTPGSHVNDSDLDILGSGGYVDGVLDWGNDDYFRHDNVGCLDIEDSPYWDRE